MAKLNGTFGKMRGKVGGMVARVDSGVGCILSEYNPSPANPRTMAQINQRAKMNLAGSISKMTPKVLLLGLDANSRKARSKFVSEILRHTVVTSSATGLNASVEPQFLKFSEGVYAPMAITASYTSNTGVVTVSVANEDANGKVYGAIVVVAAIKNNIYTHFATAATARISGTTPQSVTINIESNLAQGEDPVNVYVIPLVSSDEGIMASYNAWVSAGNNPQDYMSQVMTTAREANAYGESLYQGDVNAEP